MKARFVCGCLAACLLLTSCRAAGDDSPATPGTELVPAEAGSMTVTYTIESAEGAAEKKSYEADAAQIDALYRELADSPFVPLSAEDRLAFSSLDTPDTAGLSLTFPTGATLSFYEEGAAGRFQEGETAFWAAEPDTLYRLYQLFVPDFDPWYAVRTDERPYAPPAEWQPERLEEVALYLPGSRLAYPLQEGFLALLQLEDGRVRCVRYDAQGKAEWSKEYEAFQELPKSSFIFLALEDGGFLLAADGDESAQKNGVLLRCDRDGEVRWSTVLPDKTNGAVCRLFETPQGDILTAGRLSITEHPTDLLLMKFSADGAQTARRVYGGTDFDSFVDAVYTPKLGLVVLLTTQSCDGDITTRKEVGTMLYPRTMVVSFDEELQENWQFVWEDEEDIYAATMAVHGESLAVAGCLAQESGRFGKTAVYTLDAGGARTAEAELDAAGFPYLVADSDKIRIAMVETASSEPCTPQIIELDNRLRTVRVTEDAAGITGDYRIFNERDGGFFTVQQVSLSTPWGDRKGTDTAAILSRFDEKGNLTARKVYDRSRCTSDTDKLFPLPDGRILTEK